MIITSFFFFLSARLGGVIRRVNYKEWGVISVLDSPTH